MPAESPSLSAAQTSLTADPERFSDTAWDLLIASQDQARRWRHGLMDVEHLLLALLLDRRFTTWSESLPIDEDRLLDRLEAFCADQPPARDETLYVGEALEELLEAADRHRARWGERRLDVPHLLIALVNDPRLGARLLAQEGLSEDLLLRQWRPEAKQAGAAVAAAPAAPTVPAARGSAGSPQQGRAEPESLRLQRLDESGAEFGAELGPEAEREPSALERYGRDLTAAARAGLLDPVIGRDTEIRRLIQVLSRRGKNNPVLIGEPGVGKTAVAEWLAQRIVAGDVPDSLRGVRLVALDLGALIAGAKFRGQFEERLRSVLKEVAQADGAGGVVLFLDELHTVVNGERSGSDAAGILKPALARGDLRCIGATTPEDFRRTIEKDPALEAVQRRWAVEKERLAELRLLLEEDEGLRQAIAEAERDGDLEAAARLRFDQLHGLQQRRQTLEAELQQDPMLREQVEEWDIADVVARWTGIPVQRLLAGERQKLLEMESRLSERVVGQPEAVAAVAAAIRRARAGMQAPTRPVGSFLFLGPTGVGKTELAKALAAALFDEEEALVRLDMSEFMERNAVARLVGAPPGYVGYEEGGQLTEAVRRRPYAVLLLDEVEKAHPDVFNLLLQVLDDGRLTDSQGRTVDFRHTVVLMTSNLASRAILDSAKRHAEIGEGDPMALAAADADLDRAVEEALSRQFRPEFLNRIDEVIRFRPWVVPICNGSCGCRSRSWRPCWPNNSCNCRSRSPWWRSWPSRVTSPNTGRGPCGGCCGVASRIPWPPPCSKINSGVPGE